MVGGVLRTLAASGSMGGKLATIGRKMPLTVSDKRPMTRSSLERKYTEVASRSAAEESTKGERPSTA
jgi:hypothetical protein